MTLSFERAAAAALAGLSLLATPLPTRAQTAVFGRSGPWTILTERPADAWCRPLMTEPTFQPDA